MSITLKRAFELGALAMRRTCAANCGNATEGLMEGIMTDGCLKAADRKVMNHQIDAIEVIRKEIEEETPQKAAYYGSYILSEEEAAEIRALVPEWSHIQMGAEKL